MLRIADAAMVSEASALMEQYGFLAGVLVLSEDNFSWRSGQAFELEDFDALLAKGWTWCIGCDGSQEPDALFAWMDTMLEAHSQEPPGHDLLRAAGGGGNGRN